MLYPFAYHSGVVSTSEQPDVLGSQLNLVIKCSVKSKSFSEVLPWSIPWTVTNVRNDKLNQLQFFQIEFKFFLSKTSMMNLPKYPSIRCPQDHNIQRRKQRGRKETAPISNPSRLSARIVICDRMYSIVLFTLVKRYR